MSIRKKIMFGFLCLGAMLAFSGMISLFEFSRLSRNTQSLLNTSMKNMTLSKTMLDAVQQQNTSLLQMVVMGRNSFDSTFLDARTEFEAALAQAQAAVIDTKDLDSIATARRTYYSIVDDFFTTPGEKNVMWFMETYGSSYYTLTSTIKAYMVTSQQTMLEKAESLENNAYRAIMPGIITLLVAIVIVIVFAFMVNIYYINPVLRMTKGVDSFLHHDFPYDVHFGGNDELTRLNHQLDELVMLARKRKND